MADNSTLMVFDALACQIQDVQYPVAAMQMTLQVSAIPTITLVIDPAHIVGVGDSSKATLVGLDVIKKWTDTLQAATVDMSARANMFVRVTAAEETDKVKKVQQLSIADWVVVSAGVTTVGAAGSFGVEVVIQHPVVLLDRSTASFGTIAESAIKRWQFDSMTDPIDALANACTTWADIPRVAPDQEISGCASSIIGGAKTFKDIVSEIRVFMKQQAKYVSTYLNWNAKIPANSAANYSNFPLAKTCYYGKPGLIRGMKYAITGYISESGDSSIWSILMGRIVDEFQLAILPTFWKLKLDVTPFTPWAERAIIVYDDQISTLAYPGVDGVPIGGVKISYSAIGNPVGVSWYHDSAQKLAAGSVSSLLYVPKGEDVIGRIIHETGPLWLLTTAYADASAAGKVTEAGTKEESSNYVTPENITDTSEPTSTDTSAPVGDYLGAAYRYARALYLAKYRSTVEADIETCVLMQSTTSVCDNGYVCPGHVIQIRGRKSDQVIFDMYLTRVSHYFDRTAGTAYTKLYGMYCRPEGGITEIVEPPVYNPLYGV